VDGPPADVGGYATLVAAAVTRRTDAGEQSEGDTLHRLTSAATVKVQDKLLTFTDNRQDASLQAGHFNDFIHVAVLRCALHAALRRENELTFDRVAEAVVAASGLSVREVAKNPELDPTSPAAAEVMRAFTELTEYRLYEDLRRG